MKKIRLYINNVLEWKGTSYIILIVLSIILLWPFYWSFITSFKTIEEVYSWPPSFWPKNFSLSGYKFALLHSPVPLYLINSIIYSLCVSLFVLAVGVITIYGLTFYPYKGSRKVLIMFFLTRVVPPQVLWLPFIILFSRLNLISTRLPVMIYEVVLVYPLVVWMFKSIFEDFPREIIEAATLDGCSRMQALFRVVIPVVAPALAAIGMISFLWSWNEFMFPYLVLQRPNLWPITVGIMGFLGEEGVMWNALSATQILAITPALIFFIFAQKHIIKGLSAGSVKG